MLFVLDSFVPLVKSCITRRCVWCDVCVEMVSLRLDKKEMNFNAGSGFLQAPPGSRSVLGPASSSQDNIGGTTFTKPPQIHVNPKICATRNIYINKAFAGPPTGLPLPPSSKIPDRVHYNPKFLQYNVDLLLKPQDAPQSSVKKETNIHINPHFIKNKSKRLNPFTVNTVPDIPDSTKVPSGIHVNPNFLKNVPLRLNSENIETLKTEISPSLSERLSPGLQTSTLDTPRSKFVSKFKIVRKKLNPTVPNDMYYIRKVGRSRYKKVNQIPVKKKRKKIARGKSLKYVNKNLVNQIKLKVPTISEFKFIGQNKLVRKSVLQTQIESRRHASKYSKGLLISPVLKVSSPRKSGDKVSKYKIIRSNAEPPKKLLTSGRPLVQKKKPSRRKRSSMIFASTKYRSDKRKKVVAFTRNLRKNNQPCPFYCRFGHCKSKEKGTCQKMHDPKYIAICKRFVKGECNDEKCSLSHDVRPEKMPTCHHYLAGICKRTDCPYLHIKVNPKAPICRAFLQGFCADVFNCRKRHEYVCPEFAVGESCPRKKGCCYPHRSLPTFSKLLGPDEFPLLRRKKAKKVSPPPPLTSPPPTNAKPKEFTRYFLTPLVLDNPPSDEET